VNTRLKMLGARVGWHTAAALCAGVITLGTVAVASTAGAIAAPHGGTSAGPIVKIDAGSLRGKAVGGADDYLGIPYAAPPVGRLRWRAPHPAAHWTGVRDATAFGPNCPQPVSYFGVASTSEDCLYLNVYAPTAPPQGGHGHPVIVWIHGGGLSFGEGQDYNPTKLAADGAVVVTINFRLGALGFLAHPALANRPGGSSGDYGWMDQQAALRWVHRNIHAFGGNPKNVTIAGQSAGGLSVLAQVASPGARGLFERAIIQSGDFALKQTPLAAAEAAGEAFATKVGCASQTAACLRSLPVSDIVGAQDLAYIPGVVDGKVLKRSVGKALASGHFNRVPMINGTNHDEERLFVALGATVNDGVLSGLPGAPVTAENYQAVIASGLGVSAADAAVIARHYPLSAYSSAAVAFSAIDTDVNFSCPALNVDKLTSKFVPTYAYEFNDENAPERFLPSPNPFPYGAAHQSELQYLFGLPNAGFAGALNVQQQKLAATMKHYWSNFAARGVPSAAGQQRWPAFNTHSHRMISLIPPRPQIETDFSAAHHCGFWASNG
jgi:para-nitrobenzyl esterase